MYPHLVMSMQFRGSILHRRQWARVTCQRNMPSCFRLACGWSTFPPCTSAKGMLVAEKTKPGGKFCMPCSRPSSLPHATASSTRLEFKESQQRQLFGLPRLELFGDSPEWNSYSDCFLDGFPPCVPLLPMTCLDPLS